MVEQEKPFDIHPKCHTLGKNLFIGFKIKYLMGSKLSKIKLPEELLEVLKKVNQNVNVKVELGAGLDDLLKDEVPLI